jgi:hypothetical protein
MAKFFVLQGYEDEEDYKDSGFDFSNPDDVSFNETLTEII